MRKSLLVLVPAIAAAAFVPAACSSNPPPPVAPLAPEAGAWEGGFHDPGAAVVADAGVVDAAPEAGPVVSATSDDAAIDALVLAAATKNAPKMAPEGQPGRATLAPNEHFNMIVTLAPGRCYTVIGASLPNQVTQLDIKLLMPPFYTVVSAQSGNGEKNLPMMGKGEKGAICPISPIPVPYKIDAAATKGAGRIAIHVYARSK